MARSRRAEALVAVCVFAAGPLGGCTIDPRASVVMRVQPGAAAKVDSVFILVKADQTPGPFEETFPSELQSALEARGVVTRVRTLSDLDLSTVTLAQVAPYRYVLACHPSNIFSYNYNVMNVTMNCALTQTRTNQVVFKADVKIIKGAGFSRAFSPFGQPEAERGAAELIARMEADGLVRSAPATPAHSLQDAPRIVAQTPPPVVVPVNRAPEPVAVYARPAPVMAPPAPPAPPPIMTAASPPPVAAVAQTRPTPPAWTAPAPAAWLQPPAPAATTQDRVVGIRVLADGRVVELRAAAN